MATATLGFGLVSIPVKVYLAASAESVSFNGLTSDGHRTKQKIVDEVTGLEVERDTLLKGYEHAKGQYVTFTPDEVKALESAADKTIAIEACVGVGTVDLLQAEKSYYLGPDKGAERAYALLLSTLVDTSKAAVAQWGTRGREHLVLIRPHHGGLVMHTLFYADEVRDQTEVTGGLAKLEASDRERGMARMLVEQMSGAFDPASYRDRYRERVLDAVKAKVEGREVVIPEAPAGTKIVDLFEALRMSISGGVASAAANETSAESASTESASAESASSGKAKGGRKSKSKTAAA
jgi:DNA end-binding protein Ku